MKRASILLIVLSISLYSCADTVYVQNSVLIPDSFLVTQRQTGAQNSFFKENSQSLIAALALISAILTTLFTRWNVKDQIKAQLSTTVEKEWTHNVRSYLATIIYQALYISHKKDSNEVPDPIRREQFMSSIASLRVLLHINKPLQANVLNELMNLGEVIKIEDGTAFEKTTTQIEILINAAHKMFDSNK